MYCIFDIEYALFDITIKDTRNNNGMEFGGTQSVFNHNYGPTCQYLLQNPSYLANCTRGIEESTDGPMGGNQTRQGLFRSSTLYLYYLRVFRRFSRVYQASHDFKNFDV